MTSKKATKKRAAPKNAAKKTKELPVCPACGSKLQFLVAYTLEEQEWLFDGAWLGTPVTVHNHYYDGKPLFECPACHAVLFDDEDRAKRFIMPE